jgi:hypothetical protein
MKTRFLEYNLLVLALLAFLSAGCGSQEAELENVATTATPAPAPAAVSIGDSAPPVAPPPTVQGVAPAAPISTAIDLSDSERPINDQGQVMSDLEYLNYLVHELNEARITDVAIPQKAFKTEAEQMAYEEAMAQRQGPVKDLNELVTAGVLKALPEAPAGQHYLIDPTTGKVALQ